MKFGNTFLAHQLDFPAAFRDPQAPAFVDYGALKTYIKLHIAPVSLRSLATTHADQAEQPSANAHTLVAPAAAARLRALADHTSHFFSLLDQSIVRVSAFYATEEDRVCAAALALCEAAPTASPPAKDHVDAVVTSMLQLQLFALLNLTAVTKILKKHDKFAGLGGYISEAYLAGVTKAHRFVRTSSRLAAVKAQLVKAGVVASVEEVTPKASAWLNRLRPARGDMGSNVVPRAHDQGGDTIHANGYASESADGQSQNGDGHDPVRRSSVSLPLLREGKTPTTWFPPTALLPGQRLLITLSGPHGTDITAALLNVLGTHGLTLEDFSFSRLHHQVTFAVRVHLPNQFDDDSLVSDLAAAAKKWNATLLFDAPDPDAPLPASLEDAPYNNRIKYTATVLNQAGLTAKFLGAFTRLLLQFKISVERMGRLTTAGNLLNCIDYQLSVPRDADTDAFRSDLFALSAPYGTDVSLQEASVYRRSKRLVVFDMDSTLIQQEVIDEIARDAGVVDRVAEITEAAMRGEIDFAESLRRRVALLKGTPASVLGKVKERITFVPGARELCRCLKRLGYKLAVISGGFLPLALYVKAELGLDYAFANQLKVDPLTGQLTGETFGPIGISAEQVIAVGDGANDLWMLAAAGLGIAFNAKPKVQEKARTRINQKSLAAVLYLLGYSDSDMEALLRDS
ncbi:hypothetical protein BCR44DRAFT_1479240 [Catenaria anguillulae PL171]|uniref:phosphoserine phosphatase n=1 Tax=Catenaria anguillulae PL171 TaxID=765915 RepID=A0A1Y2HW04_9FUNG|nr:hypothetical protein BCR44DRAFT_1479240 [Catenaria anguillulae PL171]